MIRQYKALAAAVLFLALAGAGEAEVAPRSGNPTFDRAVDLVMENFYDPAALPRFTAAVKETIPTSLLGLSRSTTGMRVRPLSAIR